MLHQRLRAVMTGADRDPVLVDDGADVVRVDAREREGEAGGARAGRGEESQPGYRRQHTEGMLGQGLLVCRDRLEADRLEPRDRLAQPDDGRDRRGARLEAPGRILVDRALEAHRAEPVTAALPRL